MVKKKDNRQNTHTKQNYLSGGDISLVVSQRGWGLCNCPLPMCDVSQENEQMLFEFWSQGTVNPFLMISLFSNDFKRKASWIIHLKKKNSLLRMKQLFNMWTSANLWCYQISVSVLA